MSRKTGRIDKSALTFGEPVRIRDRAWLDTFADKECWNCGARDGTVVGAHLRHRHAGGMRLKPSDDLVIPLCHRCHQGEGDAEWLANCIKNYARLCYARWKQSQPR